MTKGEEGGGVRGKGLAGLYASSVPATTGGGSLQMDVPGQPAGALGCLEVRGRGSFQADVPLARRARARAHALVGRGREPPPPPARRRSERVGAPG